MRSREHFFLPVRVLSRLFRRKFLSYLSTAFDHDVLGFHGKLAALGDSASWCRLLAELQATDWVVYAKPPFGGPIQVRKYLARYTHGVAISNRRLVSFENGKVMFRWKDYAHGNRNRTRTLDAVEFIRRFLLHSLPKGFQRIRHFGFLANRARQQKLSSCRALLSSAREDTVPRDDTAVQQTVTSLSQTATTDESCPACRKGRMIVVSIIERDHPGPQPFDTS